MNLFIVNLIILWLVSIVLNYGILFGDIQKRFEHITDQYYYSDMQSSLFIGVFAGICMPFLGTIWLWWQTEKAKYGLKFI